MDNKKILIDYLERLNIDFEIKTLEDITKLIKAHLSKLPFSSLKVLLKEDISLDLNSVYENLVLKKRGGYCFEHNKLMYEVLKELGFDVEYFLARVVNNTENIPPQTHRFTVLTYEDEKYLIDVGIGFRSPSVPVKFNQTSISHLNTPYKILQFEDNTYAMELVEKGKSFIATKFDLNRCYEADFEMGHFYSHRNPKAVFVNNIVLSIIHDEVIYSLVNNKFLKIYKDKTDEVEIKNNDEFEKILKNDFNSEFSSKEIETLYKFLIGK